MILITFILIFAVLANFGLGIIVFFTNRTRKVNQAYLIATICVTLWLLANLFILQSKTADQVKLNINISSALSACILSAFQLIRLAIKFPEDTWHKLLKRCFIQLSLNVLVVILCFLPSFTKSVHFTPEGSGFSLEQPQYGTPFYFFLLYMLGSVFALVRNLRQDKTRVVGAQRLELEFLVFACISGASVGIFGTVFAAILKYATLVPISNAACAFIISLIVAYGITVHKVLTVSTLLRKATAHVLITAYLSAVYCIAWFALQSLFNLLAIPYTFPSHLISALVAAFSMLPARQRMQKAANLLFSNASYFNVQETVKKASDIFQSVTTINSLLDYFSDLLIRSFDTEYVVILTASRNGYSQQFPPPLEDEGIFYSENSALVEMLAKTHEPVSADNLARIREIPSTRNIIENFKANKINVATGVFFKSHLIGIVLFGSRYKGRVYDKIEQDAMQILCNQFAVALENAQMYTEVQDSKIRNDIMLDQLTSGVIVANTERKITLINHEAQRVVGLTEEEALGHDIDLLPESVSKVLGTTLTVQNGLQNSDTVLFGDEEENHVHVRMGSAYLLGHDQKPMGALLVFTDMTEVKLLEEQVRRADQLSSVGTLAAGMAHEIKNPLVTIKTFTQLLPERHEDDDFRTEFSTLVAHEVSRIDGIVNQLLSFSKPSHPNLVPMRLHETVEQTLKLIHEQLSQKNISLTNNLLAKHDLISGDADLLTQTLVNFNLNAIEAIKRDGEITVSTSNCTYRFAQSDDPGKAITKACIRLQIGDTGEGIEKDQLQKIFDPFFTSKSQGTGMGLSVSHGIIHEHNGAIEVESTRGEGTTFSIFIPIIEEDAAA